MGGHDRPGYGQPQPAGPVLAGHPRWPLYEGLEDPLPQGRIDPMAGIGHLDLDRRIFSQARPDDDAAV